MKEFHILNFSTLFDVRENKETAGKFLKIFETVDVV
jgi:hypothetical protein